MLMDNLNSGMDTRIKVGIKYKEKYYEEADRCIREQLRGGYPIFWMLNKV